MSISSVARHAGLSPSTVSRYLRGQLKVSAETETRIRDAMRETGHPGTVGPLSAVGLIVPELSNPYFAQLAQAVSDAAHQRGVELTLHVSDEREDREARLLQQLSSSSETDAVIVISMTRGSGILEGVRPGFPLVVLDEKLDTEGGDALPFVGADDVDGAVQATSMLVSRGHRRIAHVAGPEHLESTRRRCSGYTRALADAGIEMDPSLILHGPYSEAFGASALTRITHMKQKPTAVFAASDVVAAGIAAAAPRAGLRIPEDLSLIGFDGIAQGSWITPRLSTVGQPFTGLARTALDLAEGARRGDDPASVLLPMRLLPAESVASPRHGSASA